MPSPVRLPDRLSGAVWGHLVGDAMGVPYEFRDPAAVGEVRWGEQGTYAKPAGTWSDDGALTLALLDSLLPDPWADPPEPGGFDTADQGARFVRWAWEGAYTPFGEGRFDMGATTSEALRRLREGSPPEDAGPSDARSQGNGSLMRILPIALTARDPEVKLPELVDRTHRASRVTHGHPVAQASCALYVLLCRGLLRGEPDRAFALQEARSKLLGWYRRMAHGAPFVAALETLDTWTGRSGRGYAIDSFWSAWDAFAGASSYAETIERAIRYGNDTDTTAAIAGGMAGLHWGVDGIPDEWLAGMRDRPQVARLVDRLVESAGFRTSTASPLRVDWIASVRVPGSARWSGRLGMLPLPGKRYRGQEHHHWRDLDVDVAALAAAGAHTLVLLLPDHELEAAGVRQLAAALARHDVQLVRHPVPDLQVPDDRDAYRVTLADVRERLQAGRNVAVACMGGLGRTGTAVACLLVDSGLEADEAIGLTRETRPGTIENRDQERFVRGW